MSISQMEYKRNQIQRIREENARYSSQIADKNREVLQNKRRMDTIKSSSTIQSCLRRIFYLENQINDLENKRARNENKISDETKRLMTMENQYQREKDKKQKDLIESLERAHRQQEEQMIAERTASTSSPSISIDKEYDVFIAHASEDKKEIVEDLAKALHDNGISVWYDDFVLSWGDSLMRKINDGIAKSRYGIVVLSHNFFNKEWPQQELDALFNKEIEGIKVILPIWHNISKTEVAQYSPLTAGKLALKTSDYTIQEICEQVKTICLSSAN